MSTAASFPQRKGTSRIVAIYLLKMQSAKVTIFLHCHLLDFVSPEHRTEEVPCHFIPLNTDGETIEDLELQDNQAKLEREVSQWLRARIKQIEEERAAR